MAGEASDPQRTVPLAMIGAVVISLTVYVLLQVAFIGAVPEAISPAAGPSSRRMSPMGRSPPLPPSSGCRGWRPPFTSTPSSRPRAPASPIPAPRRASITRWPRTANCQTSSSASTTRKCRCGRSSSTSSSAWRCWCRCRAGRSSSASSHRRPFFRSPSAPYLWPRCATSFPIRPPIPPQSRRRRLGHLVHARRLHRLLGRLAHQLEGVRARHRRRRRADRPALPGQGHRPS